MVRKFAVPVAAAALVLAGCASQSTSTSGAASKPAPKPSKAQQYLQKIAQRPQEDNEGPEKPTPGRAPTWKYRVTLTSHSGSAKALISLRGNRVCWQFTTSRVSPSTAAIHVGPRGKSGRVVVVFGAQFTRRGCIVVRPVVVNSIAAAPHFYYVSLVTDHRHGALRAQL